MKLMTQQTAGQGKRAFTLVELLVVIAIIGVIASLVVGAIGAASGKKAEAAVTAQLALLKLKLGDYEKTFGSYPPDNPVVASNTPWWNPLAYELGGVRRSGVDFISEMDPQHTITTASPAQLNGYFGLSGFVNAGAGPTGRGKSFLTGAGGSASTATYIYLTNGTPGLPAVMLLQVPAEHPSGGANVWRYRSYPVGGHNPKTYDLWAEYKKRGGGTNTIGNWK